MLMIDYDTCQPYRRWVEVDVQMIYPALHVLPLYKCTNVVLFNPVLSLYNYMDTTPNNIYPSILLIIPRSRFWSCGICQAVISMGDDGFLDLEEFLCFLIISSDTIKWPG